MWNKGGWALVAIGAIVLVILAVLSGASIAGGIGRQHPGSGPASSPKTTYTTWVNPWNYTVFSRTVRTGCKWTGAPPSASNAGPTSGAFSLSASLRSNPTSTCSPMTVFGESHAGTHASLYFSPPSTGYYALSARFTVNVTILVEALCAPGTTGGWQQSNYAEVNVSLFIAAYDETYLDGQLIPGASDLVFHYDTRGLACTSGYASSKVTLLHSFTVATLGRLFGGHQYELRGAMDDEAHVVGTYSSGTAFWAEGSYQTLATSNQLNWISI